MESIAEMLHLTRHETQIRPGCSGAHLKLTKYVLHRDYHERVDYKPSSSSHSISLFCLQPKSRNAIHANMSRRKREPREVSGKPDGENMVTALAGTMIPLRRPQSALSGARVYRHGPVQRTVCVATVRKSILLAWV